MKPSDLLSYYPQHNNYRKLIELLQDNQNTTIHLKGLAGSSRSLLAASILTGFPGIHLFILPDTEEAAYFFNDLMNLCTPCEIMFFPSAYKRSVRYHQVSNANIVMRTSILKHLSGKPEKLSVVTSPEALAEKVIRKDLLNQKSIRITKGDHMAISELAGMLQDLDFHPVDFVYEPGQFALRGSIIDIFSYSAKQPSRIDFSGNEVDSIRSFNTESQLSTEILDNTLILPDTHAVSTEKNKDILTRVPFTEYLPESSITWIMNTGYIINKIDEINNEISFESTAGEEIAANHDKKIILASSEEVFSNLSKGRLIEFGPEYRMSPSEVMAFSTSPQPAFNKNFELLGQTLIKNTDAGYVNLIMSENEKQIDRLRSVFNDIDTGITFQPVFTSLHEGFIEHSLKIALYTDHQIFDRYHRYRLDDQFSRSESMTIHELTGLHPGDYVVHVDHGIGQFGGLEKIRISNREQEAVKLVYRDNDILYVSIHSLHRISKYKGKDGQPPKIYKLGTGAWQKLKSSAKKKVKDIARELIRLYALRKSKEGFRFSPDSYLQKELESSFIYEDTEDQLKATCDIKEGMEAPFPMDRLVCGDVGFGKTEVAVRAAFKAVTDSKQVALLVPTTILALQHYNTFTERLRDFPCNIDYISRLKKSVHQKKVISRLAEGKIDIVIGTHRLVSEDIRFKDLGLLIIDEEQKFGVRVKEKLKQMKMDVDTLILTATPIPRTLQLSLMGARDLSVINTPPPNRHPITTELHTFNEDIIREAIHYEVSRDGQVFIIHNRIQNIGEVENLIRRICPGITTAVVHGQMEGARLEKIMLDFISGMYDVLIATTIIESGLDIPNANTIIINNAHQFGLSDLHQLRGRVGRSNKKAFCYLLSPPFDLLTPEARKRLKAISEFSELGSGFYIAMQDLDIRGAGNLLGAEQSGFITEIGFETYHRILDEAVLELKQEEFGDLYTDITKPGAEIKNEYYSSDCQIDTDLELLFPDEYVSNISERLRLYRILDSIDSENKLKSFEDELIDRFGPLPEPSLELLQVVRLRWLAMKFGLTKIILKKEKMISYFIPDQESPYYSSPVFVKIISYIKNQSGQYQLKETGDRLTLTINNISSISQAINILTKINT
ncbi:MAG: transcription-repair coupling factor [Bacteroides sp. SM23_62_1]|nr:MAG: transcription-repair coupling factor [Bacteroides sp. SM23_62_1]